MGEKEKKATNGVPQSGVGQSLLISLTRSLNGFGQSGEHLFGHRDRSNKVLLAAQIDQLLGTVVPEKVLQKKDANYFRASKIT